MTAQALIFTISAIGISETVYLIKKRHLLEKPVCPIGENCSKVLESKYKKVFIIHNDEAGLLFYTVCSFIAASLVIGVGPLSLWEGSLKSLIFAASIFSIILTYLQWKVIKAWCFWCLMSATTVWLMAIIILLSKQLY